MPSPAKFIMHGVRQTRFLLCSNLLYYALERAAPMQPLAVNWYKMLQLNRKLDICCQAMRHKVYVDGLQPHASEMHI